MGVRCAIQGWALCLALAVTAAGLGGCQTLEQASPPADEAAAPIDLTYVPPNDPLRRGLYHFHRGEFGLAENYFRAVVEKSPDNVTAWIGLAGSYDNMRRFDLADRAYRQAIRLAGETAQILNNQGYSYMLRGDFVTARAKFRKALKRDPDNPTIENNLRILYARLRSHRRTP
jgi:Flp pilus assembly protein TadD